MCRIEQLSPSLGKNISSWARRGNVRFADLLTIRSTNLADTPRVKMASVDTYFALRVALICLSNINACEEFHENTHQLT